MLRQGGRSADILPPHTRCGLAIGGRPIVEVDHLERYPKLKLDLLMNDRFIDLVEEGVDLAIRVGKLSDMSLIARHLGRSRRVTVATPDYLKRHGTPRGPRSSASTTASSIPI
jgi:DNA-binding transcriptional LysR family regulator